MKDLNAWLDSIDNPNDLLLFICSETTLTRSKVAQIFNVSTFVVRQRLKRLGFISKVGKPSTEFDLIDFNNRNELCNNLIERMLAILDWDKNTLYNMLGISEPSNKLVIYAIKDLNSGLYFNRQSKKFDILKPSTAFYSTIKEASGELDKKIKVAETTKYEKETGLLPGFKDYSYEDINIRVHQNKSKYNLKIVELQIVEGDEN